MDREILTQTKSFQQMNRHQLVAIISRQQQEINGLRARVEALEDADIGQLRERIEELENWKYQAQLEIRELQVTASMTQGLVFILGTSLIALIGENFVEELQLLPESIDETERAEFEEKLGEAFTKIIETVKKIDTMSVDTWQKQRAILETRAATLPPLKRALFNALNQLASPSKIGTKLMNTFIQLETELNELLKDDDWAKLEVAAALLDTVSNLWPLVAVNSFVPMLRYVGWDDAAEAAGEILDCLEESRGVPRHLIRRVQPDLIAMGCIESRTKPNTIFVLLTDAHKLRQLGMSPDQAAEGGHIPSSATQLKRAKRVLEGVEELYNRTVDFPNEKDIEQLESFPKFLKQAVQAARVQPIHVAEAG